eukprot:Gb_19800 [translate_table: standard]
MAGMVSGPHDLLDSLAINRVWLLMSVLGVVGVIGYVISGMRRRKRLPPGPSGWPVMGNLPLLGKMPHHSLHRLARQFGPIMYLKLGTTHTVVASSPGIAKEFLKTNDANFANRPGNAGAKYMAYDSNDLVWAPYGPRWRMLRKVCNIHLFAGKALDDFQAVREEEVRLMVTSIAQHQRQGQGAVNLGEVLNVCTANVLGQIMLSKRVFESQGSEAGEFREMVLELMVLAGVFNIGDFVPSLAWMDLQGVQAKMKKLHQRFDDFFGRILREHQNGHGSPADFLSVLLSLRNNADGEGGQLTDTDMKALLLDLFTAGTDTSSSTVEWAITELIRHPDMMAKCRDEIDTVVGRTRKLKEADIQNLSYLQAVVKETFRLHPSTPLLLPRMAGEACEVGGYHIPKDTRLMVNVWGMGRDPDVWEKPLEFDPDRFWLQNTHIDMRGTDFELIPFGAGRRICAGFNMGIRMVQFMLATLLHSFDWSLPDGQTPQTLNMEEAFGITLQRAVPLLVLPSPRLPAHLYQ